MRTNNATHPGRNGLIEYNKFQLKLPRVDGPYVLNFSLFRALILSTVPEHPQDRSVGCPHRVLQLISERSTLLTHVRTRAYMHYIIRNICDVTSQCCLLHVICGNHDDTFTNCDTLAGRNEFSVAWYHAADVIKMPELPNLFTQHLNQS